MPYLAHFALASHPFGLTPNTEQYFPTANNTHILQSLQYATAKRGGILKVVGDVGTGKTMLCRLLLRSLMDNGETRGGVAYLNAPQADGQWLLAALCIEFGLDGTGNRAELMHRLNQFLVAAHADGRTCVVVVDEAQALGAEGLETIRLLSNLETETAKLLQIVLFGQPEVDALLARPDLRQINQRIAFAFNTSPLSSAEVSAYVQHRIRRARLPGVDFPVFTPAALDLLARASRGVPRVVNILADKALLIAYGESAMPVTDAHIAQAVDDSRAIVGRVPRVRRGGWRRRLLWGSVAVEAAALAAILAYNPDLPRRVLTLVRGEVAVAGPVAAPVEPVPAAPAAARPVTVQPDPVAPEARPDAPAAVPAPAPAADEAAAEAGAAAPQAPAAAPDAAVTSAPQTTVSPDEPAVPPVVPSSLAAAAPSARETAVESAKAEAAPAPVPAPAPASVPVAASAGAAEAAPPAKVAVAPAVRQVFPVPESKPVPPAATQPVTSAPAPARTPASAAAAAAVAPSAGTLVGRRMPDGTWRWE